VELPPVQFVLWAVISSGSAGILVLQLGAHHYEEAAVAAFVMVFFFLLAVYGAVQALPTQTKEDKQNKE
jgi:choline-glycine betaine transporter